MKLIGPRAFALLVAALVVLATGVYTDNGGFQLAGGLIALAAFLSAISQARNRGD